MTASPDVPLCAHCGAPATLTCGDIIYPHRPDLAGRSYWVCMLCRAWCGCHRGTTKPLGALANVRLRAVRMDVHRALDPKWKGSSNPRMRSIVYQALAVRMGLMTEETHVGMFDEAQCRKALECLKEMG